MDDNEYSDYQGLQQQIAADPAILGNMTKAQADSMLNATRSAFAQHANKERGNDYNLDGGFGGPVPFIGEALGHATFYVSNNTRNTHYIEPVVLNSDFTSTSLLTVKSTPTHDITVTFERLVERGIGVSPIRPASGDEPNISGRGGFMLSDISTEFTTIQALRVTISITSTTRLTSQSSTRQP